MAGETDLARILDTLDVERRPDVYTFVTGDLPELDAVAAATVHESEGPTRVVTTAQAADAGFPVEFEAAWLTLTVHSALEAVGLTAVISAALAEAGIACNVLAGYHHDHLLIPVDRADEAVDILRSLGGDRG